MRGILRVSSHAGLWFHSEFRKLWIGRSISVLGSYVTVLALPLTAVLVNSRLQLSRSVAQVAGPSLGGVLVQLVTAPLAVAVDALSFVVSAGFTWRIGVAEVSCARAERVTIWREMREGCAGSWRTRSSSGS